MKNILKITRWPLLLGLIILAFAACNKSEDLVTEDAKEGGLVVATKNFEYKLGNTPQVTINVNVPEGSGISYIEVYNSFTRPSDGAVSNEVFVTKMTPQVGDNTLTLTYADLRKDLVINGEPLPADEALLEIGASWTLKYVCYLADDGRKVINAAKSNIAVANLYAGNYLCTGTFHHPTAGDRPINEEKYLAAVSAYGVTSTTGDLGGDYPILITVNPLDNTCVVTKLDPNPYDMFMQAGKVSDYNTESGVFTLWYYYVGATGNRVIDEVYTPL